MNNNNQISNSADAANAGNGGRAVGGAGFCLSVLACTVGRLPGDSVERISRIAAVLALADRSTVQFLFE